MKILEDIKKRRSIRKFKSKEIERRKLSRILEAGRWAPSGYNNQPWRFFIVKNRKVIEKIAGLTNKWDEKTIKNSSLCLLVFSDKKAVYSKEQDNFSIGACIENMLLEAHEQGLGACWVCGVLKNKGKISKMLNVKKRFELKSLIVIGYPAEKPKTGRKALSKLILSIKY